MDTDETAYEALAAAVDDARWAFGTGFADPLSGVDQAIPAGIDGPALAAYCVMLADDALVLSHRLQEWVTRLPDLEEETAVANIALDLLGQARRLYARAGQADGSGTDEDSFAMLREQGDWRCVRLVELPIEDFAALAVRVLIVAAWRLPVMRRLAQSSADPVLAAIAGQAAKEIDYHLGWSAAWVVRLGDGTTTSHARLQAAVDAIWPWLPELFDDHPVEQCLPDVAVTSSTVRAEFDATVEATVIEATLAIPEARRVGSVAGRGGRDGGHTEFLGHLLAEMQSIARAHPGAVW